MYFSIEGNIGSGKTSLAIKLAKDIKAKLCLEQFENNPFLKEFYKNPERFAFPVEIFFLIERFRFMQAELTSYDLFNEHIVCDYLFEKTYIFAGQNLNEIEFDLFMSIFHQFRLNIPKPDLFIYLHRPTKVLKKFIENRNRHFEKNISLDYLQSITDGYFDYIQKDVLIPKLIFHLNDLDFIENDQVYNKIKQFIFDSFNPGEIKHVHF